VSLVTVPALQDTVVVVATQAMVVDTAARPWTITTIAVVLLAIAATALVAMTTDVVPRRRGTMTIPAMTVTAHLPVVEVPLQSTTTLRRDATWMIATVLLLDPLPVVVPVLATSPSLMSTVMGVSLLMADARRAREATGEEAVAMTAATTALPTGE
jgi:hypothetical protein